MLTTKILSKENLSITICNICFKNPLIAASGTFGYGDETEDLIPYNLLGGIVLKGLTVKPKEGNRTPRIAETPSGIINSIGLQNIGIERFLKEKSQILKKINTVIIANIAGETLEENIFIANSLEREEYIKSIELNVSCPNIKKGGISFGTDIKSLKRLVESVRKKTSKRLMVKLSPLDPDIANTAKICEESGADIISAINTIPAMVIDIKNKRPLLGNITGGLSGPAIRPVGVRSVWQIYKKVKIPIIGIGGISSANDVLEYILAGARAVQIGTSIFSDYSVFRSILNDLKKYLIKEKTSLSSLTGKAHVF